MVVFEQKMSAEQPAVPQTGNAGMRYYVQSQIARTSLKPNCSKRKHCLIALSVPTFKIWERLSGKMNILY